MALDSERFQQALSTCSIFMIEPSHASKFSFGKILKTAGVLPSNLHFFNLLADAKQAVTILEPQIVFITYKYEDQDLLEFISEVKAKKNSEIAMVLIHDSDAHSLISKAIELDIEGVLIKPFTSKAISRLLYSVVSDRVEPSGYKKLLREGRALLEQGEYLAAEKIFSRATVEHPKPTLAHYYKAKCLIKRELVFEAEEELKVGLRMNKIHLQSMQALFEIYESKNEKQKSYAALKDLLVYYPNNATRLTTLLRLAILTESFCEIEDYYLLFCSMNLKSFQLTKTFGAALITSGKFYLRSDRKKALDLFLKATKVQDGTVLFLKTVVEFLIDKKFEDEARQFLKYFESEHKNSDDFKISKFLVDHNRLPKSEAVADGLQLVESGLATTTIFECLIKLVKERQDPNLLDKVYLAAVSKFPDKKQQFLQLYS